MAIIIKEIQVKVTVEAGSAGQGASQAMLQQMKREIIKEVKETLRREKRHKNER